MCTLSINCTSKLIFTTSNDTPWLVDVEKAAKLLAEDWAQDLLSEIAVYAKRDHSNTKDVIKHTWWKKLLAQLLSGSFNSQKVVNDSKLQ